MCRLVDVQTNTKDKSVIQVADLKKEYIKNIMRQAPLCPNITRIMLFGSCLEERCTEDSDIDIAVFGDKTKSKIYQLKSYDTFYNEVIKLNIESGIQDYDILYFQDGKEHSGILMQDIMDGEMIYERNS